jgi:aspartate aminotransferase-like enzyme
VESNGFEFFARAGFRSVTLTCIKNNRGIDVPALVKRLRQEHGFQIDGGYGKIKGRTFRVSNMGDETIASVTPLLEAMNAVLQS